MHAMLKHRGKIGDLLIIVDVGCQVESQFELHSDYFNGSRGWSALGEFSTFPESINYSLLQTTSMNSYNFQKMLRFFIKMKGLKEYKTSPVIIGQTGRLLGQQEKTQKHEIIQQTEYKTSPQLFYSCRILNRFDTFFFSFNAR